MEAVKDPEKEHQRNLVEESDIRGHLAFLKEVAKGVVVECGVRHGISTAALLAGVVANGGRLISVDVNNCGGAFAGHPLWTFIQGSSIDFGVEGLVSQASGCLYDPLYDVVFLDTLHDHDHVMAELNLWGPNMAPGGMILVHDVETFKGAGDAVREWAAARKLEYQVRSGSNGLGVVKIPKGGL